MVTEAQQPSLLIRHGAHEPFREPRVSGYANESELQQILYRHPTLLPGVQGTAVACREFQSGAGPADVVVLHGEGDLVITECKLAQNPQVRREVVGQVIDYASRIWKMPLTDFEARWIQRSGHSPFGAFGDSADAARQATAENLTSGRFTIVLAVDGINDDLQRMIEYLNAVTLPQVQVLAFEVARVHDADVEILLPRTFGVELAIAKTPQAAQPSWTEADVFGWLDEHEPTLASPVRVFLEEAKTRGVLVTNGTAQQPSLILGRQMGNGTLWALSLFTAGPYGRKLRFWLERFRDKGLDARPAAELLAQIPDQDLDLQTLAAANYRKWIHVPFAQLHSAAARALILDALDTATAAAPARPLIKDQASGDTPA